MAFPYFAIGHSTRSIADLLTTSETGFVVDVRDGSCPKLASILPEGRKAANICSNSGVIRGIPVNSALVIGPTKVEERQLTKKPIWPPS